MSVYYDTDHEKDSRNFLNTECETNQSDKMKRQELIKPNKNKKKDVTLLKLINKKLGILKKRNNAKYYKDNLYMSKRWIHEFGDTPCSQITAELINKYFEKRKIKSPGSVNYEKACLKSTFNLGVKEQMCKINPMLGINDDINEIKVKHIPTSTQINQILQKATTEQKDYIITIRDTSGRICEINRLKWEDVDLSKREITLYKLMCKDGIKKVRKIYISDELFEILKRRYKERNTEVPWIFWHRCWRTKYNRYLIVRYKDRRNLMKTLCRKANIPYFSLNSIRYSEASVLEKKPEIQLVKIKTTLDHDIMKKIAAIN